MQARYDAMSESQLAKEIQRVEKKMFNAAKNLEFEQAALHRDELKSLKNKLLIGFTDVT